MIEYRIDHIGLNVADLDAEIDFLHEMFGFTVIQRWDSPRQAFVGKGSVVLGLMENRSYNFAEETMAHIAFPCCKVDFLAVVAKVKALNARVVSGPRPQREGETIMFRDPSGNIFEVCYPAILK
jgi:catechol 2,3-dioxygenase-like lactoylglutathione lyase family enzyme